MFAAAVEFIRNIAYKLVDNGLIPDFILRPVIRAVYRRRLRRINLGSFERNHAAKMQWIEDVRSLTYIADKTEKAKEQHYEVSTKFMLSCLGDSAKYSCCLYPTGSETLDDAEVIMMESYCQKANLSDGLHVLDLGCGWGSLTLYLAQKYPKSKITGLSNSATQKTYIERAAQERKLSNVEIINADINVFDFKYTRHFDRILSIEMFEHMKNYKLLMKKVSSWLRPKVSPTAGDSLLFIHIFCHRTTPYHYDENGGWMAKTFFSGGTMPSHDLLLYFQDDISLVRSWYINGTHYSRTCQDWLKRQDANAADGLAELEHDAEAKGRGKEYGRTMFYRFRVFYIACAEFFATNGGEEWGVGHYLFKCKG